MCCEGLVDQRRALTSALMELLLAALPCKGNAKQGQELQTNTRIQEAHQWLALRRISEVSRQSQRCHARAMQSKGSSCKPTQNTGSSSEAGSEKDIGSVTTKSNVHERFADNSFHHRHFAHAIAYDAKMQFFL